MPSLHFKSHQTAVLANFASDNTAANSCFPSSKTLLTSENNFPVCGLVAQYFLTAENLNWKGRTGMQCSEGLAPLWAGFVLQFGAVSTEKSPQIAKN